MSEVRYSLKLFVTEITPRIQQAIKTIEEICNEVSDACYELEVINVFENPEQADEHRIILTPTLVKDLPPPLRRVIGDLTDTEQVRVSLALDDAA